MREIKERTMYQCPDCYEDYPTLEGAERCISIHDKAEGIKTDFFENGLTLSEVWRKYDIYVALPDYCNNITKDNCFVVSHLQCCDFPAYQISEISPYGEIKVCGDGSWNGGYCSKIGFYNLKDPRPKEELWKYSNSGQFGRNKKVSE